MLRKYWKKSIGLMFSLVWSVFSMNLLAVNSPEASSCAASDAAKAVTTPGSADMVVMSEGLVFIPDGSGLRVVERDTGNLFWSMSFDGLPALCVMLQDDLLMVGLGKSGGISLIDWSDPTAPLEWARISGTGPVQDLWLSGLTLYAVGGGRLHAYWLYNLWNPYLLGSHDTPGAATAVRGDEQSRTALVFTDQPAMVIVDISSSAPWPQVVVPLSAVSYETSCLSILQSDANAVDGVYKIDPDGEGGMPPFDCYCDMTTDGGGWTVIQRRQDGSEDFYRNWADYKNGFGSPGGEYWLGNDRIHQLTADSPKELWIDMTRETGESRYAAYSSFSVADEASLYRSTIAGFSGSAGDSLTYHHNQYFSTFDRDSDGHEVNCSARYKGGWWYRSCHYANLNGLYLNGPHSSTAVGVEWYHWTGHRNSLIFVEMKIR